MSKSDRSNSARGEAVTTRFDFHDDGDRGCPHCGEVALAFDPAVDRARCRTCGEAA